MTLPRGGRSLRSLSIFLSRIKSFAAANVRIEKGQKVTSRGVYGCPSSDVFCRFARDHWHATCARIVVGVAFVSVACILNEENVLVRDFARLRRIYAEGPISIDPKRLVKLLMDAAGTHCPADFHSANAGSPVKSVIPLPSPPG